MRDMRAKAAKTGVAHEASSRREGGTVRPDRRERVRKSAASTPAGVGAGAALGEEEVIEDPNEAGGGGGTAGCEY